MVERITSRRSTLRTLPALREEALPRPWAQRMCCGVHTESSADRSEMGKIDRSRRRRGCAGALRHKICTASLDNRPLIDGFVWYVDFAVRSSQVHVLKSFDAVTRLASFWRFSTTASSLPSASLATGHSLARRHHPPPSARLAGSGHAQTLRSATFSPWEQVPRSG